MMCVLEVMAMSAYVQGITSLTVDLIVRSLQHLPTPVTGSPARVDRSARTTQLADSSHVDAHHVDVTA